jgi:hypothetical protein
MHGGERRPSHLLAGLDAAARDAILGGTACNFYDLGAAA